jgi:CBS domain-containing protein
MSERERFDPTKEALQQVPTHQGPTAERCQSALSRYLAALAGSHRQATPENRSLRDEFYWKIGNILVSDVMTRNVVSTQENTKFKDIVQVLDRYRVSALPVVDAENNVLGVVSESDLLAKVIAGTELHAHIRGARSTRVETRRKSRAETARELMHSPAVTTRPDVSVVHAARAAAFAHVRRMPVVDGGKLVGIVTRSDLLRVFLRDDEAVCRHLEKIFASEWCIDVSAVGVAVQDGVVTLSGEVERRSLIEPLEDAVRGTAGVVAVHNHLTYRHDDRFVPPPAAPYEIDALCLKRPAYSALGGPVRRQWCCAAHSR